MVVSVPTGSVQRVHTFSFLPPIMQSCPCGPMLCGECQFEPSAGWKAVSNRNASNQDITQDHISKIP